MALDVNAARVLMADSLAFHIIFAMLGVGLPLVILFIEHLGNKRKDPLILEHAKRLSQATIILVVAGVASGTIISIQMSLMWGKLIKFGGPVLGLAFGWEGYAFMIEAVFLTFYVASWGKIKGWKHWLIGIPVAIGSLGSAFAITLGNAWMQNPGRPDIINGHVVSNNPLGLLLTKTAFFMISHSVIGYYLATILCVLGIYAIYTLKHKPENQDRSAVRQIMFRLSTAALLLIAVTAVLGHLQTQHLAQSEPRKFAALESVEATTSHAPYLLGSHLDSNGRVEGGVRIPNGLSILTGNSPNTKIRGLQDFPKNTWPMLFINILFETKMLLVGVVTIIPLVYTVLHSRRFSKKFRDMRYKKPMLVALTIVGPIAVIVVILGWMVAEFGRQPFAVNGYLRTTEAFSATTSVIRWGYIFPTLYLCLFTATGIGLWQLFKRKGKLKPAKGLL